MTTATQTQTDTTTSALLFKASATHGTERTVLKASLDDACRNGHADFSLTCDIYENGRDVGGGCAHEHILKVFKHSPHAPMLAELAALHLSDADGVPMHATANAFYWFCGMFADGLGQEYHGGSGQDGKSPEKCREILADHIRADAEQVKALADVCPMDALEMSYFLEKMGFRAKWKAEAYRVQEWLETVTGKRFAFTATRETWPKLTPEQVATIETRRANGYHTPEQREARRLAKAEAARAKRRAEIEKDYTAICDEARIDRAVSLALVDCNARGAENTIYYKHTRTISANWATHRALWSRSDWDSFVAVASKIPDLAGLKFEWNDKPKS
jgi:hypothetical protein